MKRSLLLVLLLVVLSVPARALAQQPARPPAQSEFVPVDQLPQEEQMPAAPLVITAYAIAWVATLIYLGAIWRRLGKVDRELSEVARRVAERSRT